MDATAKRLCAMLREGDSELRSAAARVMAELRPDEPAALAALAEAVRSGGGQAPLLAVRALAASPDSAAVEHLLAALGGTAEVRREAEAAIAAFGAAALPHLEAAWPEAPLPVAKGIATALAHLGGKRAWKLLLAGLAKGDLELSKHICFELDQALPRLGEEGRAQLAEMARAYLAEKGVLANETAAASGIILLGFLKSPRSKALLLKLSRPRRPAELRRRALQALRGIAAALSPSELAALAAYLEEEDIPNVVLPAIELLRPLALPPSAAERLVALAGSAHPAVRDFALAKLGQQETPEAAAALAAQLDAPEPAVREMAVAALQHNPAAVPLLLKRVKAESDPARLWTLVRVLEPQAGALGADQAGALVKLLLAHLEAGDRRGEPLSYLLRRAAPQQLDAALLKRAVALKAAGRLAEAESLLATLLRGGAASPEALYEAATIALKLSHKGLSRSERHADPCLGRIERLLEGGAPELAQRLCSDAFLGPDDLFYVGFHFAEQLGERRAFGGEVLRHVAALSPRSATAASARNKLRLEAFPPEPPPAADTPRGGKRSSAT